MQQYQLDGAGAFEAMRALLQGERRAFDRRDLPKFVASTKPTVPAVRIHPPEPFTWQHHSQR